MNEQKAKPPPTVNQDTSEFDRFFVESKRIITVPKSEITALEEQQLTTTRKEEKPKDASAVAP